MLRQCLLFQFVILLGRLSDFALILLLMFSCILLNKCLRSNQTPYSLSLNSNIWRICSSTDISRNCELIYRIFQINDQEWMCRNNNQILYHRGCTLQGLFCCCFVCSLVLNCIWFPSWNLDQRNDVEKWISGMKSKTPSRDGNPWTNPLIHTKIQI